MINKLSTILLTYRLCWILLTLICLGVSSYGLKFLKLNPDIRAYSSDTDPQLIAYNNLENEYSKNDNILIVISSSNKQGIFLKSTLEIVETLTNKAWEIPYSRRVSSVTNFQHMSALDNDIVIEDLFTDVSSYSAAELNRRKEIALTSPELSRSLISKDGNTTGILITLDVPVITGKEVAETVAFVKNMIAPLKGEPQLNIRLFGNKVLNNAFSEASVNDLKTLYPIMILIIMCLLIFMFKGITATLTTLLVVVLSSLGALGAIGWLGLELAPVAVSAPVMIMTLAIADCVHVLVSYSQALETGKNRISSMSESLKLNIRPIFITSITTAIGFMSLNFSDSPPYRDFGNLVAIGVLWAFILSIFVLPQLVSLMPWGIKTRIRQSSPILLSAANFSIRHGRFLIISMLIVFVSFSVLAFKNQLNDGVYDFFDSSIEFRRDADFVNENLTGISHLYYSVSAEKNGSVSDSIYLANLDEFTQWLKTQNEVSYVHSLTNVMKRLNRSMHADDPSFYHLPNDSEMAAQYLLLYELSLPYGLDLTNLVNFKKSASRVTVKLNKADAITLINFNKKVQQWLKINTPENMWTQGASIDMMFAVVSQSNAWSMIKGMLTALVIIAGIVMIALRSIPLGLISLSLNFMPLIIALGIWGVFVGQVGLAVSTVLGMTLGIVVDNNVHFLSKIKSHMDQQTSEKVYLEDSIRYAYQSVGVAILFTTIVLAAGFSALSFSNYNMNADMALLTTITIVLALLMIFLFLPALLLFCYKPIANKVAFTALSSRL